MMSMLAHTAAAILDWIVPRQCVGCSATLEDNPAWCRHCIELLEPNLVSGVEDLSLCTPYRHAGPIRSAIHQLKYAGRSDYAEPLVAAGFGARPALVGRRAVLVPVPLHSLRLVERGYNQSALLAQALGRHWGLPVNSQMLRRTFATAPQVGQSRERRAINMVGAFAARPMQSDAEVWLVDDVVTTGATTASCRRVLEAAGLHVRGVIALAHAELSDKIAGS